MRGRLLGQVMVAVLLLGTALGQGCAPMLMSRDALLMSEARYGEMVAEMEPRWRANPDMPFRDYVHLCSALSEVKRYDTFFSCVEGMQRRVEQGDDTFVAGMPFRDMPYILASKVHIELGDYDRAIAEARRALTLAREDGGPAIKGKLVNAWEMLGLALALRGDTGAAEEALLQLRALPLEDTESINRKPRDTAVARICLAMGRYGEAVTAMSQQYPEWEGLKAMTFLTGFTNENFLSFDLPPAFIKAKALYGSGRTQEAKTAIDALLGMEQIASSGTMYWNLLHDRGRIALADGEPDRAIGLFEKAVAVIERQRATLGSEASKIGFVGDKQTVYADLVAALVAQGRAAEALAYVERGKSRALVDLLAQRTQFASSALAPAEVEARLAHLQGLEAALQSAGGEPAQAFAQRKAAVEDARAELARTAPQLASLVTVEAEPAAALQARLAPGEVLLEYFAHGDALWGFAADRTGITGARLDGAGLADAVRGVRAALETPQGHPDEAAARLSARILAPLARPLANARLITVVPHGPLHYIPFAALPLDGDLLIDRAPVRVLPSASVLRFLRNAPKRGGMDRLLILGNPDLGDQRLDLPGAATEAASIKALFPGSVLLTRDAATESRLKTEGSLFPVIHIAAHGEFRSDAPLASRLLLAPDAANDGSLTAGELFGLRLDADLVTLSACDTGLGKAAAGDDVIGLTRGFLYAGANALVASLWPVADAETGMLMRAFYGNLRTMPKAEALRAAQSALRATAPHPYYWAAFQLTGSAD
ncbi:MAG: CHAT domain-containing protein [Desulfovibrionaceae bacterium]